jgi:tetratricopeptide (TPR) repeat protein
VASVSDPALQFSAHYIELSTCIEGGDFARAQTVLERMKLIAEELGQPTFKWFATFPTVGYELMRGNLAAAERLAEHAFKLGQDAGEPDAILIYGAQLGYTRACQGRGQEIVAMLEQSVNTYPAIAAWRAALVWTLCWIDRQAEAAAMLEQAAGDRFEDIQPGAAKLTALALYADAAAQTDATGAASILYGLIEPWAEHTVWNTVTGCGHARLWLGLLAAVMGEHEHADEQLLFACEFHETNGLLLWAARAHLGWAEALARRGDAAAARERGARALELSRDHGYGAFEARAAALLGAQSTAQT